MCHIYTKSFCMRENIPWNAIIARIQERETEQDAQRLKEWLADKENVELYQHLKNLYFNIQRQASEYNPDTEYYWKEMQTRMHKQTRAVFHNIHVWKLKYIAAAVVVGIISVVSTYLLTQHSTASYTVVQQSYESFNGKSKIILPDSSVVWLNHQSSLCYESKPNDTERRVSLNGEAFFNVTKNLQKEFIVDVKDVSIHVHGTLFCVKFPKEDDKVTVTLIEGSISLETPRTCMYMVPGEKAYYSTSNGNIQLKRADTELETSWASPQIRIENKSLIELSKYFEKWYGTHMIISPELSARPINYSFTITDESLEEILILMMRIHPISYQFGEKDTLFINPL